MTDNALVSREELIRKLQELPEEKLAAVLPFLEADLESVDELSALHREIEAGRRSARTEPILDAEQVYARVRQALSK